MLDVLVVAPHPDDAELGMAGAIMKFKDDGWRVGVLDLTNGEPTPHGTPGNPHRETAAATTMGLDSRRTWACPIAVWKPRWMRGRSWRAYFACSVRGRSSPYSR